MFSFEIFWHKKGDILFRLVIGAVVNYSVSPSGHFELHLECFFWDINAAGRREWFILLQGTNLFLHVTSAAPEAVLRWPKKLFGDEIRRPQTVWSKEGKKKIRLCRCAMLPCQRYSSPRARV